MMIYIHYRLSYWRVVGMKQYQLCLLAQACGDAYGATYEFMTSSMIPKILPDRSIGGGPFNFLPGDITDDTDMAIITLDHLIKYKKVEPVKLKKAYKKWAMTAKDVGIQVSSALLQDIYNIEGQGNGALMRIIPSIVFMKDELNYSVDETKHEIRVISKTTHINEEVQVINDFFIDKIYDTCDENKYLALLNKISATNDSTGWVYNSARIVINTLAKNIGFLEGYRACIRLGGDTDTHCAIYGAYLGAFKDIREELDVNRFVNIESLKLIDKV